MSKSIIQTLFTDLNRGGRIIADANTYVLLKTVTGAPDFPGRDRLELLSIQKKGLDRESLTRILCEAISQDLHEMYIEYEADASALHRAFHGAEQPVDLENAPIHILSPYMRNRFGIHTDYDLVDEHGERERLFYMNNSLVDVGPDQVEITVRKTLENAHLVPDVSNVNEADEQLRRYTRASSKGIAP